MTSRTRPLAVAAAAALAALALAAPAAEAQFTAYGITTTAAGQQLVRFDTSSPFTVTTLGITGATLRGLDFRPATGMLYGYDGDRLYTVNTTTGAATLVGDVGNTMGSAVGFDFNPTVDRIRVVDGMGTNLRLNPITPGTTVDGTLAYAAGDVNAGAAPDVGAVGYTFNDNLAATGTTLFGIDGTRRTLVRIAPPNDGIVNTVGALGVTIAAGGLGFDIVTVGGTNRAFLSATAIGAATSTLYEVNLATGAATLVGEIGVAGGLDGLAIATVPEPGSVALVATGLVGLAVGGWRRRGRATA